MHKFSDAYKYCLRQLHRIEFACVSWGIDFQKGGKGTLSFICEKDMNALLIHVTKNNYRKLVQSHPKVRRYSQLSITTEISHQKRKEKKNRGKEQNQYIPYKSQMMLELQRMWHQRNVISASSGNNRREKLDYYKTSLQDNSK